jgi:hypothetical protein
MLKCSVLVWLPQLKGVFKMKPEIRKATPDDLRRIWEMNIADNAGDDRWIESKDVYIAYNESMLILTTESQP